MGQSVAATKPRKGFGEVVRKFFVTLKRNPQNIPLVMMLVTYVIYSLNLTSYSTTTAVLNKSNMGLCQFLAMLLGILSFVSYLRAYPRREKPKIVMILLTVLMLGIITVAEFIYSSKITEGLNDPTYDSVRIDSYTGEFTKEGISINTANSVVNVHIILLIICIALIVLLPVYSKAIRAINTSIDVAGNEDMQAIDMASDE